MNIFECQNKAEELGFDNTNFIATFPKGDFKCYWLDAYMGMFVVDCDGMRNGFMTVRSAIDMFIVIECKDLKINTENEIADMQDKG